MLVKGAQGGSKNIDKNNDVWIIELNSIIIFCYKNLLVFHRIYETCQPYKEV